MIFPQPLEQPRTQKQPEDLLEEDRKINLSDVSKQKKLYLDDVVEKVKSDIEKLNKQVLSGEISILESTVAMGKLTRDALVSVADQFANILNVNVDDLPFSLFVFGATARNQMLPNSDLDAAIIFRDDCPEEIKEKLKEALASLPFNDDLDLAHWESIEEIRKENCPSMMEYNKVAEARFIAGNGNLADEHARLLAEQDTREEKEGRFMTEYGLLHKYDYRSRQSEEMGPNLKYDYGASRDIVFLDWYYAIQTIGENVSDDQPTSFACLDLLKGNGKLNEDEYQEKKASIELILLLKFVLWHKNAETGDKKLMHLSDYSLDSAFESFPDLFKKYSITNADELAYRYLKARNSLQTLVIDLYNDVSEDNPELVNVWQMAKEEDNLTDEVREMIDNAGWNELIPFAVNSSSPEILAYIVENFGQAEGYEYVLRVISENNYITDEIRSALLESRLDKRKKKKLDKDRQGNLK